jgi:hypothetical protein
MKNQLDSPGDTRYKLTHDKSGSYVGVLGLPCTQDAIERKYSSDPAAFRSGIGFEDCEILPYLKIEVMQYDRGALLNVLRELDVSICWLSDYDKTVIVTCYK